MALLWCLLRILLVCNRERTCVLGISLILATMLGCTHCLYPYLNLISFISSRYTPTPITTKQDWLGSSTKSLPAQSSTTPQCKAFVLCLLLQALSLKVGHLYLSWSMVWKGRTGENLDCTFDMTGHVVYVCNPTATLSHHKWRKGS